MTCGTSYTTSNPKRDMKHAEEESKPERTLQT